MIICDLHRNLSPHSTYGFHLQSRPSCDSFHFIDKYEFLYNKHALMSF
ncbi:hypothetical protein HMPREF0880_00278 [Yokenella regensburgei ATCC 43003]|nr:hypothetical protein HMPREF0880_00278 [Yokenella regensburgei ATCC 43003]